MHLKLLLAVGLLSSCVSLKPPIGVTCVIVSKDGCRETTEGLTCFMRCYDQAKDEFFNKQLVEANNSICYDPAFHQQLQTFCAEQARCCAQK